MSVNFPSKPPAMSGDDYKDPKKASEHQEAMADYNLALQTIQHEMNQEEETRSNMEKSKSDAMMGIINNMKA